METLGYKELLANDEIRDSSSTYPLVLSDHVGSSILDHVTNSALSALTLNGSVQNDLTPRQLLSNI